MSNISYVFFLFLFRFLTNQWQSRSFARTRILTSWKIICFVLARLNNRLDLTICFGFWATEKRFINFLLCFVHILIQIHVNGAKSRSFTGWVGRQRNFRWNVWTLNHFQKCVDAIWWHWDVKVSWQSRHHSLVIFSGNIWRFYKKVCHPSNCRYQSMSPSSVWDRIKREIMCGRETRMHCAHADYYIQLFVNLSVARCVRRTHQRTSSIGMNERTNE